MRLLLAVLALTAPLGAQNCTFAVTPTTFSLPAAASTGNTVTVTNSPSNCNQGWVATSSSSWIHITSQTYNGSGTVVFSVDANPDGISRQAMLSVVGQTIAITQAAASCSFAITPSTQNFPVAGANGSVAVAANCAWSLSTDVGQWVTIPNSNGNTAATVAFTVGANGCLGSRSGRLFLSGSGLANALPSAITQDGSPANFSISATSATVGAEGGPGHFAITTGVGCGWSASSNVSWMHITGGATGSGNGNVAYTVDANSSDPRTGVITVSSAASNFAYTVTQQTSGPPAPVLFSVSNAANYTSGSVSPGEIVTLFGQNLGPTPAAPLQLANGAVTSTLGGTQVLFDGVAAPMIFSFQSQVSAVAPYGLAGKTSTQVQLKYSGVVSSAMTVPVQPSTPAIFTLDSTGLGPGAILNQDYSINSTALPAPRGSVVSIYCAGGGATNPASADGAVVSTPLPQLTLPVSVSIGGLDAPVTYAGGVPGSIAGLTQINAQVPASLTPGNGIPIVIKIGGVSSSNGVTISVN
jgi:uncharacterized protein (TIGR03437 family)